MVSLAAVVVGTALWIVADSVVLVTAEHSVWLALGGGFIFGSGIIRFTWLDYMKPMIFGSKK